MVSFVFSYLQAAQLLQPLPAARNLLLGELQSLASYVGSQAQRAGNPATPSAALQQALQEAAGAGATASTPRGAATAAGSTPAPLALQPAGTGLPPCFGPCIFCVTLCTLLLMCLCTYSALLLGLLHGSVYLPLVTAEVLQRPNSFLHSMYHARGSYHVLVVSKMFSAACTCVARPICHLACRWRRRASGGAKFCQPEAGAMAESGQACSAQGNASAKGSCACRPIWPRRETGSEGRRRPKREAAPHATAARRPQTLRQ